MTRAITAMRGGDYSQQVQVRSQDELGVLARTFNEMSAEIAHANHLRRQMTADIAHDLRTPLMVISGYLEALRDGTLQPTQARFDAMNQEAVLLKRLVDDLRTLSLADAGELKLVYQSVRCANYWSRSSSHSNRWRWSNRSRSGWKPTKTCRCCTSIPNGSHRCWRTSSPTRCATPRTAAR